MAAPAPVAPSKNRRWPWLVAAALLFGAGAWLMAGGDEVTTNNSKKVSLPRRMTSDERMRNDTRRTMEPVGLPLALKPGAPAPVAPSRDPLLAAMPTEIKNGAVVIEANAIRNSELGNLMIECVFTGQGDVLEKMRDAGFDPLENLDRVAVADDAVMLTGDFSKSDIPQLFRTQNTRQFGANSEIFTREAKDGRTAVHVGRWKGQLLVVGDEENSVTAVLDRLDGKGDPNAKRVLTDVDAYGEMYGVLKPGALAGSFSERSPELARLIQEGASLIKVHADVSHDVGLVADIQGSDPTKTQDLRKMIGTTLTLAKLQAEANGNKDAAEVLGFARVAQTKDESGNFHVEAGLPFEFLQTQLRKCVDDKKKKLAEKEAAPN